MGGLRQVSAGTPLKKETWLAIMGLLAGVFLGSAALSIDWNYGELPSAEAALAATDRDEAPKDKAIAGRALQLAGAGETDQAIKLVRADALSGLPSAQFVVGTMHANGWGTSVNLGEAGHWWAMAARQGHAEATFWLGLYLLNGDERARRNGWSLVEMASERGSAEASMYIRQINAARVATVQSYYNRLKDEMLRAILAQQGGRISIRQAQALQGFVGPSPEEALRYAIQDGAIARNIYNERSVSESLANYGDSGFRSAAKEILRKATDADDQRTRVQLNAGLIALPQSRRGDGGLIDPSSGEYFTPSGAGYTSTRNGTFYSRSGPNGITDTHTGQFIPVN